MFEAGEAGKRVKVGLLICEDAWFDEPARLAHAAGAELLAVINASPFHVGKGNERETDDAPAGAWTAACRWSMPTWWVGRTRWCLKAIRLR